LPWTAVAGTAALAVAVVAAGLPVRRWMTGRRDAPLDPLVAARTVVLAKAAAYGGALLAGWYAAQALVIVPDLVGVPRTRFLLATGAAAAAIAVCAAGFVVQRWCRVPPDDGPDGGSKPVPGGGSGGGSDGGSGGASDANFVLDNTIGRRHPRASTQRRAPPAVSSPATGSTAPGWSPPTPGST
jgi:uncharacterized membrane protein YgcG